MPGFANAKETWNARFARDDYIFGRQPNAFVEAHAHRVAPGKRVLCVADGEGRNSVWLAERGMVVTAFDFAGNALVKARALAAERGVVVQLAEADILDYDWTAARYDAVFAVFIQFLSPEERPAVFAGMKDALESATDAEHWWRALSRTAGRVLDQLPRGVHVSGVCLSAMTRAQVLLDNEGRVLAPALLFREHRAVDDLSMPQ